MLMFEQSTVRAIGRLSLRHKCPIPTFTMTTCSSVQYFVFKKVFSERIFTKSMNVGSATLLARV